MKLRHTGVGHFEVSVSNFTPKQSVTCATGTNPYNNNIGLVPIDSYTVIITEATQDKQQTYNLQENKEKKKHCTSSDKRIPTPYCTLKFWNDSNLLEDTKHAQPCTTTHTIHNILHFSSHAIGNLIHRYKKRPELVSLDYTASAATISASKMYFVQHNTPNHSHELRKTQLTHWQVVKIKWIPDSQSGSSTSAAHTNFDDASIMVCDWK